MQISSPEDDRRLTNTLQPGTFLIFLHIQKTAGMTIQNYLRRRLGPSRLTVATWRLMKNEKLSGNILNAARARTHRDRYFSGHFCFGMHRHLPAPASYMTFLRDPVSRIVSLYHYSRNDPGAYYHRHACDATALEFVERSGLMEIDNGMTRFLSGSKDDAFINRAPVGTLGEADLVLAKHNLETYFCFAGLQEIFDESFLLLARLIGDPHPSYRSLNRRKDVTSGDGIGDELRRAVLARSELDYELYRFAQARLLSRLENEFPDLQRGVSLLRRTNASRQTTLLQRLRLH